VTIHIGKEGGAYGIAEIREVVSALRPNRIGHGILAAGDGNMPPLIPPELVGQYRASDEAVRLKTGAEILFRSLEEQNVGKP
jgi:adenosine deaminase